MAFTAEPIDGDPLIFRYPTVFPSNNAPKSVEIYRETYLTQNAPIKKDLELKLNEVNAEAQTTGARGGAVGEA